MLHIATAVCVLILGQGCQFSKEMLSKFPEISSSRLLAADATVLLPDGTMAGSRITCFSLYQTAAYWTCIAAAGSGVTAACYGYFGGVKKHTSPLYQLPPTGLLDLFYCCRFWYYCCMLWVFCSSILILNACTCTFMFPIARAVAIDSCLIVCI
jgi:hypothetical protein